MTTKPRNEWKNKMEKIYRAVSYEFTGGCSHDAHRAAQAMCLALEDCFWDGKEKIDGLYVDVALLNLGEGWDRKSVLSCLEDCQFYLVD